MADTEPTAVMLRVGPLQCKGKQSEVSPIDQAQCRARKLALSHGG